MSLRHLEQQGIVASFVQDIFPLGRSTVQRSFIGSWLWHVPQALQKSRAMDQAAEALALAYFAKKADSKEVLIRSQWIYSSALIRLSKALLCPRSQFASETLCATLLFVHYEVRDHIIITWASTNPNLELCRNARKFVDCTRWWHWPFDPTARPQSPSLQFRVCYVHGCAGLSGSFS